MKHKAQKIEEGQSRVEGRKIEAILFFSLFCRCDFWNVNILHNNKIKVNTKSNS